MINLIDRKEISNNKKTDIKDDNNLTVNIKIKILLLFGIFEEKEYEILHKIRKKRNSLMHNIKFIKKDTAVNAFELASKYLNNRISE